MAIDTVWVTGAGGLIGNYLLQAAPVSPTGLRVRGLTRQELDLTDLRAVRDAFHRDPPGLVLHCAALSKSPACQANPELANRINVEATAYLAELCEHCRFVLLSTDLVFDGKKGNYDESVRVNPLSIYAETKAKAEEVVLRHPKHLIIRTSLNGGVSPTRDRGFNEEMRLAWAAGKTLNLFVDEFRSPIGARVTARAIWELALQNASGIFHVAGAERVSRWEIGNLLAERCPELNPNLRAGTLQEYAGAPRAPDTSLNCARAQKHLSFVLPPFSEWLKGEAKEEF